MPGNPEGGLCITPLRKYMETSMPNHTLIYSGFDGLDMAYRVTLPGELHAALKLAKAEAGEARRPVALEYRGVSLLVSEKGASGGYAFSVDTGFMGANWWFKAPHENDRWGARVSSKSLPLALNGIEAVKNQHDQFLRDLGMEFGEIDRRISRIDYAIDFIFPELEIDPALFVSHSNRTKTIDGEFSADYRGDKINGIRIGKMPNSQIAIYDKRREIAAKKKSYWWSIWQKSLTDKSIILNPESKIWRFEFRAGRNFLEHQFKRKTWDALSHDPAKLFSRIANQTRLADPAIDTNRARWPNAPIWNEIQDQLAQITMQKAPLELGREIILQLRAEYAETICKQTVGLIVSQAAFFGLTKEELPSLIEQIGIDVEEKLTADANSGHDILEQRRAGIEAKYNSDDL